MNSILNAPSKWDLAVAFFSKVEKGCHRTVTFTVYGPDFPGGTCDIEVGINSLKWEDGSGESWLFEGFIKKNNPINLDLKVKGWFRTSDRKGWIDILKNPN
jgi:hypothetical protein